MPSINDIIDEFECADDEQRLYLFLMHRDLRSEFMKIVRMPKPAVVAQPEKKQGKFCFLSKRLMRKVFPVPAQ